MSHLVAASLAAGGRPLVLKDGDTFAVFDQAGGIRPGVLGEEGLFHESTRFLPHFTLELEQHRLLYLDSWVGPVSEILKTALTNPPLITTTGVRLALATLHISIWKFLWAGVLYQRVVVTNYGTQELSAQLNWSFAADYADIFEVREPRRTARGQYLEAELTSDHVCDDTGLFGTRFPNRDLPSHPRVGSGRVDDAGVRA